MRRIVMVALVLLAPLPVAWAEDAKKDTGQDLKVDGKLSADDPKDKVITKSPHKVHEYQMKAGAAYIIDLKSRQFDSFLRLEDSSGKQLAADDDSGGFPNARIVHKATKDDNYRIIVTSFDGKGGAYTLTVKAATEAYAKVTAIKDEFQKGMMAVQQRAFAGGEIDIEKYYDGVGELQAKFLDRFLLFAEANANDSSAVAEANTMVRQMVGGMGNSAAEIIGAKLRSLIAKTKDNDLLGPANLALGQHLAKRYEKAFQKKDAAAAKIAQEAEAVLEKTGKEFTTLSAQAQEALFDLAKLAVGRKAMDIEGEDIDGQKFKLSDYRGKVVVIDFWGDW